MKTILNTLMLLFVCCSLSAKHEVKIHGNGKIVIHELGKKKEYTATIKLKLSSGELLSKKINSDKFGKATVNFPEDFNYEFNGKDLYVSAKVTAQINGRTLEKKAILPATKENVLQEIYTLDDILFPRIPLPQDDCPDAVTIWAHNDKAGMHYVVVSISTDKKTDNSITQYEHYVLSAEDEFRRIHKKVFSLPMDHAVPANIEINDENRDGIQEIYFGVVYNDGDFYPQEYYVMQGGEILGFIKGKFGMKHSNLKLYDNSIEIKNRLLSYYKEVGINNSNGWGFF